MLTSCVVAPFPYWKSEGLEKVFLEDFPPDLRASYVKVLVLEQRARLVDREGCKANWELGCGHESTEQMIEAPIFAQGKDIERIVSGTRLDRIQGMGIAVAVYVGYAGSTEFEMTRSGSRLKVLAILTQDGSLFCTRSTIEHHSLGHMFRSFNMTTEAKIAAIAALQAPAADVSLLPLVQGSCELSGTLLWSDADRKQVIEFLKAIPVGLAEPGKARLSQSSEQ